MNSIRKYVDVVLKYESKHSFQIVSPLTPEVSIESPIVGYPFMNEIVGHPQPIGMEARARKFSAQNQHSFLSDLVLVEARAFLFTTMIFVHSTVSNTEIQP